MSGQQTRRASQNYFSHFGRNPVRIYLGPDRTNPWKTVAHSHSAEQLSGWASRSRLELFRTLAKTVRQHWAGILAYFDTGLSSAAIEAVDGIIQLAKRMARGFKNSVYFRTAAYL